MKKIQDREYVKEQYKDAGKLKARISIHQKYSVNKQGFGEWIFEHYQIKDHADILEIGCGSGDIWGAHIGDIPSNAHLYLTDFSEGMLSAAKENLPQSSSISFKKVDIQSIPFPDQQFDIVIANMMLYHVPDLDKGLSEVKRVLKTDGAFYCATYGKHGISEYIQGLLSNYGVNEMLNKAFTLQNGGVVLKKYFHSVEMDLYDDHLEVTNIEDFLDYIFSLTSLVDFSQVSRDELRAVLQGRMKDGKLEIPKEYGLFTAKGKRP